MVFECFLHLFTFAGQKVVFKISIHNTYAALPVIYSLTESCQKVVFLYVVLIPMIILYILWLLSFKRWFFTPLAFYPLSPLSGYPQFYPQLVHISFYFICQKVVLSLQFSSFCSIFHVIRWFFCCQKVVLN